MKFLESGEILENNEPTPTVEQAFSLNKRLRSTQNNQKARKGKPKVILNNKLLLKLTNVLDYIGLQYGL